MRVSRNKEGQRVSMRISPICDPTAGIYLSNYTHYRDYMIDFALDFRLSDQYNCVTIRNSRFKPIEIEYFRLKDRPPLARAIRRYSRSMVRENPAPASNERERAAQVELQERACLACQWKIRIMRIRPVDPAAPTLACGPASQPACRSGLDARSGLATLERWTER